MVGVRREDITWCWRSLEKYSKLISTASLKLNSVVFFFYLSLVFFLSEFLQLHTHLFFKG